MGALWRLAFAARRHQVLLIHRVLTFLPPHPPMSSFAKPFIPLDFQHLPEEEMLRRARQFYAEMNRRRTTRHFSDQPVPRELIEHAIRTAGTAPSGAHQQPWTFVAISDPEIKRVMREAAEEEELQDWAERAEQQIEGAIDLLEGQLAAGRVPRERVEEARVHDTATGWEQQLAQVLDYTTWHQFVVTETTGNSMYGSLSTPMRS